MEHFPLINRLHTDVLEEKYGLISVKLLKHTLRLREAHLVDKKGISRTYSLTFFPKRRDKQIATVEKDIAHGKPIGKTFREHGYEIRKNVVEVFILRLSKSLRDAFATKEQYAKARIAEFYAKKHGFPPVIYGNVLEVYSPDFRAPKINKIDKTQDNAFTFALEKCGFTKDEIWIRLGDDNNWKDVQDRYKKAKKLSLPFESKLKKKISEYIDKRN